MFESGLKEMCAREKELAQYPDYEKRRSLFLSWIGQADKCLRKGNLQDSYYFSLGKEWLAKCEKLLEGKPIEECKGKVKVKGAKPLPKKQRIKWKAERKQELRQYRKMLQQKNYERQKEITHETED